MKLLTALIAGVIGATIIFISYVNTITEIDILSFDSSVIKVNTHPTIGKASWYDYDLDQPYGEGWSKRVSTAASRTLPRYSLALIRNISNNKEVQIYINDYGPEEWTGREIDLSSYAFSQIADLSLGIIEVEITPL